MVPEEEGSIGWVQGIIDWEGNSGAFEHISSDEITDLELRKLWVIAEEANYAFDSAMNAVQEYLDKHLNSEDDGA